MLGGSAVTHENEGAAGQRRARLSDSRRYRCSGSAYCSPWSGVGGGGARTLVRKAHTLVTFTPVLSVHTGKPGL